MAGVPSFLLRACLVLAIFMSAVTATTNTTTPVRRRVHACILTHRLSARRSTVQHFVFANSRDRFPNLDVIPMIVGSRATVGIPHSVGVALAQQTKNCTVLVGPGDSDIVRAASILVDAPIWVGATESWTEFQDNKLYPRFNRVTVSADTGGVSVAIFTAKLKWRDVNLLSIDTVAGQNFLSGFTKTATSRSINVNVQRSIPHNTHPAAIRKLVKQFRESRSRVIVAGVNTLVLSRLIDALKLYELLDYFYFIFSPDLCAETSIWSKIPGAFCTSLPVNATRLAAFQQRYHLRTNRNSLKRVMSKIGVPGGTIPPQLHNLSIGDALGHDAAHFALAVMDKYWAERPAATWKIQPGGVNTAARVINRKSNGTRVADALTGDFTLSSWGERSTRGIAFLNSVHSIDGTTNATSVDIKTIASIGAGGNLAMIASATYAGQSAPSDSPPSHLSPEALAPPPPPPPADPTLMAVLIAALGAVLVIAALSLLLRWILRERRMKRYPRNPAESFTVMFFSVKNEAVMRTNYGPDSSFAVCSRVATLVERATDSEDCIVARRLDAHFMVAARDVGAAMRTAGRVARAVAQEDWPKLLGPKIKQQRAVHASDSKSVRSMASKAHSNRSSRSNAHRNKSRRVTKMSGSLRPEETTTTTSHTRSSRHTTTVVSAEVSVGIAAGHGRITIGNDPFDVHYSGLPVEHAALLTDYAQPGQILVSQIAAAEAEEAIKNGTLQIADAAVEEFTAIELPGANEASVVSQLDPRGLPPRTFTVSSDQAGGGGEPGAAAPATGSLSSALEEAAGGLATRPVAIAAIVVPELQQRRTLLADAQAACAAVADAAEIEKGAVVSTTGGVFIVAVNATGRQISQAVTRAANVATAAVHAIRASGMTAHGGVDCGAAAVGKAGTTAVTCTDVAERATALARLAQILTTEAHRNDLSPGRGTASYDVLATASALSELQLSFAMQAVDICVWRTFGPASKSTGHGAGDNVPFAKVQQFASSGKADGSGATDLHGALTTGYGRPSPVYSATVMEDGEDGSDAAGDEWMYELDAAEGNDPNAAGNAAVSALALGDRTLADHLLSTAAEEAEKAAASNSLSANALNGGAAQCPIKRLLAAACLTKDTSIDAVIADVTAYGAARVNAATSHHSVVVPKYL